MPTAADEPKTLDWLQSEYCKAKGIKRTTQLGYLTTIKEWERFETQILNLRSIRPKVQGLEAIDDQTIVDFLNWSHQQHKSAGDANPGRSANKVYEHLRAWLSWAWKQGLRAAPPRLPDKFEQRDVAGLYFLTDDECCRLYDSAEQLPDPPRWSHAFRFADAWTAAIVGAYLHSWDTSTIWRTREDDSPIRVRDVVFQHDCPRRTTRARCESGWISWTRRKTSKPFTRPMNACLAAHVRRLTTIGDRDPDEPLHGTCWRPMDVLRRLVADAGIPPAIGDDGREHQWTLKDLRKTSATVHEENMSGSAEIIMGHSSSQVTRKHYANREPAALKAVLSLPMPASFARILQSPDQRQLKLF